MRTGQSTSLRSTFNFEKLILGARLFVSSVLMMVFFHGPLAAASDSPLEVSEARSKACSSFLEGANLEKTPVEARLGQSYSLWDLIENDMAIKHPSMLMSAAQRILAIIREAGASEVAFAGSKSGRVKHYPFFSEGTPRTEGKQIIGNEALIPQFVNYIKNAARDDSNVIFLEGPHGTGKTVFQDVINAGLRYATAHDPDHYYFTFEWVDLQNIPDIVPFVQMVEGQDRHLPIKAPMNSSPVALLPESVQKQLLKKSESRVRELTGMAPRLGVRKGSPKDEFFKRKIWEYYQAQKGSELTYAEMIEAVSRHVRVVPKILGEADTTSRLSVQNEDFNVDTLVTSQNKVLSMEIGETGHPAVWNYDGSILRSNGGVLLLDEFPRYPRELQQMMLEVFESRRVNLNGVPETHLDTLIITGGNTESIEEMKQKGGLGAVLDRLLRKKMLWQVDPRYIVQVLLLMQKNGRLMGKDLVNTSVQEADDDHAKDQWQRVRASDLFNTRVNPGDDKLGPDGRLALKIDMGEEEVHVAPHTLLFLGGLVALTRSSFDTKKAKQAGEYEVISSPYFKHPIPRLKYLIGEASDITSGQEKELTILSNWLVQGSSGLAAREVNRFFAKCVQRAVDYANGDTPVLTPQLVKEVFIDMLQERDIEVDVATMSDWRIYADQIVAQIILPKIQADVHQALGREAGHSEQSYDEVVAEVMALQKSNGEATSYRHPVTGQDTPINFKRLSKVKENFKDLNNGRELNANTIAMFMAELGTNAGSKRHDILQSAINRYYVEVTTDAVEIPGLLRAATSGKSNGNTDTVLGSFFHVMEEEFGYTREAAIEALRLIQVHEQQKRSVEAQKEQK